MTILTDIKVGDTVVLGRRDHDGDRLFFASQYGMVGLVVSTWGAGRRLGRDRQGCLAQVVAGSYELWVDPDRLVRIEDF